jgi:hypothetical protein
MEKKDLDDLRNAVMLLEDTDIGMRLLNLIGYPIEGMIKALPRMIGRPIGNAVSNTVSQLFYVALCTMNKKRRDRSFRFIHEALVVVSGAIGGFFSLPGLIVELPISTALMLRSIADIARSEGEDISSADTQLACITVFGLGGRAKGGNAAETAYYAVRAALARTLSKATEYIAERGVMEESAPIAIRMMTNLASRFGLFVTDKMAAEMVPVLGGLGGATINLLFIKHFQATARGHFTVRRLERKYGQELVKREYERVLRELRNGVKR